MGRGLPLHAGVDARLLPLHLRGAAVVTCVPETGIIVVILRVYDDGGIRGGVGGKERGKKIVKKTRKSKKKWSLKKNRAEKTPKSKKKWTLEKKIRKKKHQKKYNVFRVPY